MGNGMAYCNNNPVNWRDPFGEDPNKKDAINLKDYLKIIRELEAGLKAKLGKKPTPHETLSAINANLGGSGACRSASGSGSGESSSGKSASNAASGNSASEYRNGVWLWRYIYTRRAGWVDMGHFFKSAGPASYLREPE